MVKVKGSLILKSGKEILHEEEVEENIEEANCHFYAEKLMDGVSASMDADPGGYLRFGGYVINILEIAAFSLKIVEEKAVSLSSAPPIKDNSWG